jgi:hypothetical protein
MVASQNGAQREGPEVLGHEDSGASKKPTSREDTSAGAAEQEHVKGEGFEVLGHEEAGKGTAEQRTEAADAQEESPTEERVPPASGDETGGEAMRAIDVYSVLRLSIAQLAGTAWQMMGLQPDPFTNQVRKRPDEARTAIDATAALVDLLAPHLQGQERKDYENLLTDLRLNFVSHSAEEAEEKS